MAQKRSSVQESNAVINRKIKLEYKIIKEAILKENPKFDIKNHELEMFLIILDTLINQIKEHDKDENSNGKKEVDTEDGIKDIAVSIGEEFFKFPQSDTDSLDLPDIIKKALKTLKGAFTFVCAVKSHGHNENPRSRSRRGIDVENVENLRRRNKDINIKKPLAQTKNIQVKHKGQVVRRITIRRKSIFPAKRRQREY